MKTLREIVPTSRILEMARRRLKEREQPMVFEEIHGVVEIPQHNSYLDFSQLEGETQYQQREPHVGFAVIGGCIVGAVVGMVSNEVSWGLLSGALAIGTGLVVDEVLNQRSRIRVLSWEKEMLQRSWMICRDLWSRSDSQLSERYQHLRNHSASLFLKSHDEKFNELERYPKTRGFFAMGQTKH